MKMLNKAPFKRGDRVRCVSTLYASSLKMGGEYTILQVRMDYGAWNVEIDDGMRFGWRAERFEKISGEDNETVECR